MRPTCNMKIAICPGRRGMCSRSNLIVITKSYDSFITGISFAGIIQSPIHEIKPFKKVIQLRLRYAVLLGNIY